MLDTRDYIETPEGALLPLAAAGILVRAYAYLIDWSIRLLALALISMALGFGGHFGRGLILICYFLSEWFYPVVFEVWFGGATPGKRLMGLKVVNDDGTPIGFSPSLLRNLLMAADFLPLFYMAGIVSSLCHRQFKRLGDIAAGTLVIHRPRLAPPPRLDASLGVLPIPLKLLTREQRAIVNFAERCDQLAPARQRELARQLGHLLPADQPVVALLQMANTIAGSQSARATP